MDEYQVHNIALKTLKQRCEYLQQRLHAVEEENCKLKLEKAQVLNSKTPEDASGLEQRIITLNEEKSQMAYQIQMLTTENLNLWSCLSEILPGSNISDVRFSVSVAQDDQLQKFHQFDGSSKDLLCDYDKESLEEISLKLINGIIMGKNELEKQYSQMIDLQKEDISESKTSSLVHKQFENRAAVKNLKNYIQKLKDFRQALYGQRNELSSAILLMKTSKFFSDHNVKTVNKELSDCEKKNYSKKGEININQPGSEFSTLQDTGRKKNEDEKSGLTGLCPMCGKSIPGSFQNLYSHVNEHFEDENDEFVDASSAFECQSGSHKECVWSSFKAVKGKAKNILWFTFDGAANIKQKQSREYAGVGKCILETINELSHCLWNEFIIAFTSEE